jgi:hypothetical protein
VNSKKISALLSLFLALQKRDQPNFGLGDFVEMFDYSLAVYSNVIFATRISNSDVTRE